MALTLVSQPEYTIDTPGFGQLVFTAGSEYLALPHAVRFATQRNSVLQSAREAIVFRLAAEGTDGANRYQITRTAALYFKDNDGLFVAFDDDPAENIILAQAPKGYHAHGCAGRWLVTKTDPLISGALQRATKADRILPVPLENTVRLSTTARGGTTEYGTSRLVRATIGDMAEPHAGFLQQQGCDMGYEGVLTPSKLDQFGIDNNTVEVRPVGVGGSDYGSGGLVAGVCCDYGGRARGVRETFTGNKGGC